MNRSRPTAVLLAAALTCTSLLAACGGDDKEEPEAKPSESVSVEPTPTAVTEEATATPTEVEFGKPAKGVRIKGNSYVYVVPVGWIDNTAGAREVNSEIDTSGAEADGADGFRNNVTVTSIVATGGNLDDLEADLTVQLGDVAKNLEQLPRILLDGREMAHHEGLMRAKPVNYLLDQYAGIDDEGQVTVIAFAYARNVPVKVRTRTTHSILASWTWQP
ncbi:hypothetical protein [Nocardioides daejeonensis]|uniref:hypothetical protein n=1 Tax=Nocardioides daejeonensis TaxID=1046556 RepID=UPI000D74226E|nr:hypothetical protein [Nocardioides daejeonensis]